MEKMTGRYEEGINSLMVPLKNLLLSYLVTLGMLLMMAFFLYKVGLSEKTVSLLMILVYAGSTFLGGFLTGKKLKKRKFLWGMAVGGAYFVILLLVSWFAGRTGVVPNSNTLTTMLLCIGGGMLGGMLS